MITKKGIDEVIAGYNSKKLTVCTIGSHSALQIAKGAKDEGLPSLLICTEKNAKFYKTWPVVDEVLAVDKYTDILSGGFQEKLRERNAVLVPHGSFVEYVGAGNIREKLDVPMLGSRVVLEWESDRKKQFKWLKEAGARTPGEYKNPKDIDRLVIVKFPGAKGGAGYFLARNEKEYITKMNSVDLPDAVKAECMIQEYVVGTRFYPHFFYSPLDDSLQLLGMDIRYESNVDGLSRIPEAVDIEPSYVVTGNIPVVMRESLLPGLMDLGRSIVTASKRLFSPGMLGPFCLEMVCTQDLEFICFEVSARIVAGTNVFTNGSPYSCLLYDEPMSCGRRISREIKNAAAKKRLGDVLY
jgi:5-formaminoimidazole-4-carboxamide-1-(beta)-D-ribofuranosyl 5'-monophosphate synthetase